ncbi:MAG TPA: methyltransferase, partial [bacterium]|nr:methyltransferase [bacterium]
MHRHALDTEINLMSSRELVRSALNHQSAGRVPIEFGATAVTGIHVNAVAALRDYYGLEKRLVKVHEPYQMLGWIDEDLQEALGVDVDGLFPPKTMFGFPNEDWQPWRLPNGLEVLVSRHFQTTRDTEGNIYIYPQGDTSAPPSGKMPNDGFFFDTIVRQEPIDEARLDPADNLEEFGPVSSADLAHFAAQARRLSGSR